MRLAIILILFCIVTPAYADNVRIGGSWDVSPHSDGDDKLSDGAMAMTGYERQIYKLNKWVRMDAGAWATYLWYDTQKEKCQNSGSSVACVEPVPTRDRDCDNEHGTGYAFNVSAIAKPTVSLWIVDLWGMAGAGPDYQDTDGWSISWTYGFGADVIVTESFTIGAWTQQIIRSDGGEYRIPAAVGFRLLF